MRRYKSNAKSKLYWKIYARQQLKKEHFMSHRVMRAYLQEPHAELYGPLRLFSRWMSYKKNTNR